MSNSNVYLQTGAAFQSFRLTIEVLKVHFATLPIVQIYKSQSCSANFYFHLMEDWFNISSCNPYKMYPLNGANRH